MKALGLKLLRAESEAEISRIIQSDSLMSEKDSWFPVDRRDTNFNVITNQSSTGGKAATELITNMVDAMLMKHCLEKGIDPKSPKAPPTMYRAVDVFVQNMNGGRIIDADETWLRNYAMENLVIGVTGVAQHPCYTFADNGEGQHPEDFSKTFLSLSAKNKSDIPFVQGKYNMGSSGVLSFCGHEWFKLIVSRRFDKSGTWGWTLIRRRPGKDDEMPVAEYFAPGEKIPTLEDMQALYPFRSKDGREFAHFKIESGTVVKLYDFYAGKNFGGFRGAREAFNENLVETILPLRILDFRWSPDHQRGGLRALGIDARPFYGMEFLLRRSHGEDVEAAEGGEVEEMVESEAKSLLSIGTITHPRLGKIVLSAVPLKKQPKKQSVTSWFGRSANRVFHHVNGQVMYKETRGLLTQCRLPALKDRVAIFVDASGLKDKAHLDIWKGDRESIRETTTGEEFKAEIRDAIRNSSDLKEFNHRIAREELDSAAKESSRELVVDLVKRDRNLMLLLDQKIPDLPAPAVSGDAPKVSLVAHKYSPTFLKIKGNPDIELPINKTRPIPCLTDAAADYFDRADNRGDLHFENDETANLFIFNTKHDDIGNLVVFVRPNKEQIKVGEVHSFKIGLKDDALPAPVYSERTVSIKIVEKLKSRPKPRPVPPDPPIPPQKPERGLPLPKFLTRDGRDILEGTPSTKWEDAPLSGSPFNEEDGGTVIDLGEEGKIYWINYDNTFFQNHLKAQKHEDRKASVTQKYILGMRIALLGIEHALASEKIGEDGNFDDDKFRRMAAKGAAAVIMTLCDQLPKSFDLYSDEIEKDIQ